MKSETTSKFWKSYNQLPSHIRKQAKEAYSIFKNDLYYPSLQFKRIHSSQPIYSVRIMIDYRSVGVLKDNSIIWFWIGTHSDYDTLVKLLKK